MKTEPFAKVFTEKGLEITILLGEEFLGANVDGDALPEWIEVGYSENKENRIFKVLLHLKGKILVDEKELREKALSFEDVKLLMDIAKIRGDEPPRWIDSKAILGEK